MQRVNRNKDKSFYRIEAPMENALVEIKNKLEEFIHQTKMEMDRITRELAKLENSRENQFERLSREGSDSQLRRHLDETDEKINVLKTRRQQIQTDATITIREYRMTAEKIRDHKINELKAQYGKIAEERDALRDEVIPELEQEIRDLSGKKKNLDGQLLTITSEINALNQFTIEVPSLE